MKAKIKDIYPNPYKKNINEGALNQEQIDKLKASIMELGMYDSLPVFSLKGKLHLVNGHHRRAALEQLYGEDYEAEVTPHDYTEEQYFRGMVVENLTQRSGEFREERDNIFAIRDFLSSHKEELSKLRDSRDLSAEKRKHIDTQNPEPAATDIAYWLDPNEKIMTHDVVSNYLKTAGLAPEIVRKVERTHKGKASKRKGEVPSKTQAFMLSDIKDHKEQKDIWNALQKSREKRVREHQHLVSQYLKAPDEVKQKIRKGKLDIADVEQEISRLAIQKEYEGRPKIVFIPNFAGRLKAYDRDVLTVETQTTAFEAIFGSKQFQERYDTLTTKQKESLKSVLSSIKTRLNRCIKRIDGFLEKTTINYLEDKK